MKHTIEFKDWEPARRLRDLVEQSIARLDKLLVKFPKDPLFLRAVVERNAVRSLYRVSITLELPGKTLAVQETRHDDEEAVREAFAEMEREIQKYREKESHSWEYKRPARRKALQVK
jgi:ribosome-associated translation inhibitor RaiA